MGWAESGQAWGERAADWAYLIEPYARRANDVLFDRAARALASAGPSWAALQAVGYDRFAAAVREAIRPFHTEGLGVRIVSEFGWILGRVPG
jgi:hypothetical protein